MVFAWCFRLPLWVVLALSPTSSPGVPFEEFVEAQ